MKRPKPILKSWKNPVSNLPDDWYTWDKNDPRSPAFEEPIEWCEHCEYIIDEEGMCNCEELDFD